MTEFDRLCAEIGACRVCLEHPRGRPLPHAPRPVLRAKTSARILVAGQAPGTRVHASGRPFDDPSGVRLRRWMGVDEATFYDSRRIAVVPMGFCFPGQTDKGADLPPRPECAATWHDRLIPYLSDLRLVLAIGAHAQRYHLTRLGLARYLAPTLSVTLANWRAIHEARAVPRVFVLPHPSWRNSGWLKRHPWFEAEAVPLLQEEIGQTLGDFPLSGSRPISLA